MFSLTCHHTQVLEKTCGDGEVHCCRPRASKLYKEDLLNMLPPNSDLETNTTGTFNDTINPLGRAYHNYTDGVLYYTSDISTNDTATESYLNNFVDNLASPLTPHGELVKVKLMYIQVHLSTEEFFVQFYNDVSIEFYAPISIHTGPKTQSTC